MRTRRNTAPPAGRIDGRRGRPVPAGTISPGDRHVLAVRQALRWAAQAAGAGDYDRALRALTTIERVEGTLPDGWQSRRQAWITASHERATQVPGRERA